MKGRLHPGLLIVLLLTLCVCSSARHMDFVGDDVLIIEKVRALNGLAHPAEYFRFGFFSFYRPFTFLSHALDWQIWGIDPRGYHLTNVLLHVLNTALVWAIGRRLMPAFGASIAALLFAVHASNHEAVFWISGRFDLMAAACTLGAFWLMTGTGWLRYGTGLAAFALGLLSKESALAFPIIVAADDVFVRQLGAREVAKRQVGILLVVGAYAWLRWRLAGLDPIGGTGRVPKALILAVTLIALGCAARIRWPRIGGWARGRGSRIVNSVSLAFGALLVIGAVLPVIAPFVREKLAFAGFALFYLLSPFASPLPDPIFLGAGTSVYWLGGLVLIVVVGALLYLVRHHVLQDGMVLWTIAFCLAALIPVSSMTEGKRYLYLASVSVAILGGLIVTSNDERAKKGAVAGVLIFAAVSAWQFTRKAEDWVWAGAMTREAIQLVDGDLASRCRDAHVVLLTAPVGLRGVYTHLYRESFAMPRGCEPARFTTIARMVLNDSALEARWDGPSTVEMRANPYECNFVLSPDLRHFTVPLRATRDVQFTTPIGDVRAYADGWAEVVRVELGQQVRREDLWLYYFSDGHLRRLDPAPSMKLR